MREVEVGTLAPRALLLMGDQPPSALITGMAERGLPMILSEARLKAPMRGPARGAARSIAG